MSKYYAHGSVSRKLYQPSEANSEDKHTKIKKYE